MGIRRLVLAVTVVVALAGCKQSLDLDAIRSTAAAAATAQESLDAVAQDFYDSCVRRHVYTTISAGMSQYFPLAGTNFKTSPPKAQSAASIAQDVLTGAPPDQLAALLTPQVAAQLSDAQILAILSRPDHARVLAALPPAALSAMVASPALVSHEDDGHACDESRRAAQAWQSGNAIVVGYFEALGQLAGGSRSDDTFGVKALATSLAGTHAIGASVAKPLGDFANTALTNIYDAKRRNALAAFIPKADLALGNAVDALDSIASDQYAFVLNRERVAQHEFLVGNLRFAKQGSDAFAVLNYADAWSAREKGLDDRMAGIQSYVATLQTLRGSHAALLQAIDANDGVAAFNVARALYASLQPDVDALRSAFKGGK